MSELWCTDEPGEAASHEQLSVAVGPVRSGALALALSGSGSNLADLDSDSVSLVSDVARIFAACADSAVSRAGSGGAVSNALPRLRALGARFPKAYAAALLRCAEIVLASTTVKGVEAGRGTTPGNLAAVELLAAAAVATPSRSAAQQLLQQTLGLFSGTSAPKDRHVRHRCAELLWQLLAAMPQGQLAQASPVLFQLSRDRFPAVRSAAVPGLALLESYSATAALVALASHDPVSKIRMAALAQLQMMSTDESSVATLKPLLSRSLDVSPHVRTRLYAISATLGPDAWAGAVHVLLTRGLRDGHAAVRAASSRCSTRG